METNAFFANMFFQNFKIMLTLNYLTKYFSNIIELIGWIYKKSLKRIM